MIYIFFTFLIMKYTSYYEFSAWCILKIFGDTMLLAFKGIVGKYFFQILFIRFQVLNWQFDFPLSGYIKQRNCID